MVDGKYSMELYMKALRNCYQGYSKKLNKSHLADNFDYFCFHCPFAKMVQKAFESLIKIDHPNISSEEVVKRFIQQVEPSLFLSQRFGNIYNGSLYMCLLSLLLKAPEINNKKVMMFSYGSGICSTMFEITVVANPVSESQKKRINTFLDHRVKVSPAEFSKIMSEKEQSYGKFKGKIVPNFEYLNENCFYLTEIDSKWRRSYEVNNHHKLNLAKDNINALKRIPGLDARI